MTQKNLQIEIPGSHLACILEAASQWYLKIPEAKKSWEVGFSQSPTGKLRVSCAAESAYLECDIPIDASAIEAPVYLDGINLSKIDFTNIPLTLVIPRDAFSADSRVQFKMPGSNFRIPRKSGTLTARTAMTLESLQDPGRIKLPLSRFQEIAGFLRLPDGYKVDKKKNPDAFKIEAKGSQLVCYSSDHFAGYYHEFVLPEPITTPQMQFLFDFLTPALRIRKGDNLELIQTARHSGGIMQTQGLQIFWIQPNLQQALQDVPGVLQQLRRGVETCLEFKTGELLGNIERACSLLEGQDFYDVPILLSIMQDQYTVSTHQTQKDLSFSADGKCLTRQDKALKIQVQSLCFKKYLSEFDRESPFAMEVFNRTLILWQKTENHQLTFLVSTFGK